MSQTVYKTAHLSVLVVLANKPWCEVAQPNYKFDLPYKHSSHDITHHTGTLHPPPPISLNTRNFYYHMLK
jgi:hypothetical protein